ncbi:hypothetical protein B0O99DRAFT_657025 [Bisporella sp. PMI_857]|nr:hypothetical protein B0O99DRAFT_657025 [Bisporella sp. PMI_857]
MKQRTVNLAKDNPTIQVISGGFSTPLFERLRSSLIFPHQSLFIYPIFVSDNNEEESLIPLLPEIRRLGILKLVPHPQRLVDIGLRSAAIFGVLSKASSKDAYGTAADDPNGPVIQAIRIIHKHFPNLYIVADVCICECSSHGHYVILKEDGSINNQASEGLHCLAPPDMNDGRIRAVKAKLLKAGIAHEVTLMAYSAKFCSLTSAFGDRKTYQVPIEAGSIFRRAFARDIREGPDIIIVKLVGSRLDIIRSVKDIGEDIPIAAYQVSEEYAMIHAEAEAGIFDLKTAAFESTEAILRAGGTVIISYLSAVYYPE